MTAAQKCAVGHSRAIRQTQLQRTDPDHHSDGTAVQSCRRRTRFLQQRQLPLFSPGLPTRGRMPFCREHPDAIHPRILAPSGFTCQCCELPCSIGLFFPSVPRTDLYRLNHTIRTSGLA